jgi:hypothetical protein
MLKFIRIHENWGLINADENNEKTLAPHKWSEKMDDFYSKANRQKCFRMRIILEAFSKMDENFFLACSLKPDLNHTCTMRTTIHTEHY